MVKTSAILQKTPTGVRVIKDRSVNLTHCQRLALIVLDGRRTVAEILALTEDCGTTIKDFEHLVDLGVVEGQTGVAEKPEIQPGIGAQVVGVDDLRHRYEVAYPLAVSLASSLGLGGVGLILAVERASCYTELVEVAQKLSAVVGSSRFRPLKEALAQHSTAGRSETKRPRPHD